MTHFNRKTEYERMISLDRHGDIDKGLLDEFEPGGVKPKAEKKKKGDTKDDGN